MDGNDYRGEAEKLIGIMLGFGKSPFNRSARELSIGEKGLLNCLSRQEEGITAGMLSRMFGIGAGGVTNLLNSLEKKGYVTRTMSPTDRRSVVVTISPAGRALAEEKQEQVLAFTAEVLCRMGREDADALIRLTGRALGICEEIFAEKQAKEGKQA